MKDNHMDVVQIDKLSKDIRTLDFVEEEEDFTSDEGNEQEEKSMEYTEVEMPADLKHLIEQLRYFNDRNG